MLEITSTDHPEYLQISLRGEITSASASQLERTLAELLAKGPPPRWLLDLGDLLFTSSAGLRVFLTFAKRTKTAGGRLAFCNVRPAVAEVFEVSGFTQILTIAPDAAAAAVLLGAA
jgi:anti-anti-sigma factor